MPLVNSTGFSHVRLTVTDIRRSKAFYDQVFGWPVAVDASEEVEEAGVKDSPERLFGGVIYRTPRGGMLGLRPAGSASFDSRALGLDHVSFAVESVEELDRAAAALSAAGVEHGEVKRLDRSGIAILSFQDPDDINLELTAPLS